MRHSAYDRKNIFFSFKCAFRGLGYTIYSQRNMIIHLFFLCVALGFGLYFHISNLEWVYLSFTITLVLVTELINTAIEISIDLVTRKRKFRAMLAKDIAAGAVLLASMHALVAGYLIFFNRFCTLFSFSGGC